MMKSALNGWNAMRLIRLLLGAGAAVQGIVQADVFWIAAGSFLVLGAMLNAGCCGSTGCPVSYTQKQMKEPAADDDVDGLK